MADFNPDKFLAETAPSSGGGFDPDKFLAETAAPAPRPVPGRGEAAYRGAVQGATMGFGDELAGAAGAPILQLYRKYLAAKGVHLTPQAAAEAEAAGIHGPQNTGPDLIDEYRAIRDQERGKNAAAESAHKGYYVGGNLAGAALTAPLLPGGATKSLGGAIKAGAALGAANGLGSSDADLTRGDVGSALLDSGIGSAAGGAAGALGYGAGKVVRGLVNGAIKPTEAAQLLRAKGVPLTAGQMNPGGFLSKIEEAGQHSALGGHEIAEAQAAAREGWQNAALNEGRPIPGALRPGGIQEKLAGVHGDFAPAYQAARDAPVLAAAADGSGGLTAIRTAFNAAAEDPSVYATDEQVKAAKRFLDNQVTLVERAMEKKGDAPLKAEALLTMRGNIRGAIRDAVARRDSTAVHLLGNAEEALTGSLEHQLPPDALDALHAADSKYGTLKTIEDAVRRGGDQEGGFSPAQLSQAVRSNTPAGAYARGAGGPLRDLAQAGREVLDAKNPSTGAKLLTLPMGLNHAAGPVGAIANQPGVKSALLGETGTQQWLRDNAGMLTKAVPGFRNLGKSLSGLSGSASGVGAATQAGSDLAHKLVPAMAGDSAPAGQQASAPQPAAAQPPPPENPTFKAMGKVGAVLQTDPGRLGKFGVALTNIAQQRGPEAAAAAHFVLSQSNPEYQHHLQSLEDGQDLA